jgi:hypothetical protein
MSSCRYDDLMYLVMSTWRLTLCWHVEINYLNKSTSRGQVYATVPNAYQFTQIVRSDPFVIWIYYHRAVFNSSQCLLDLPARGILWDRHIDRLIDELVDWSSQYTIKNRSVIQTVQRTHECLYSNIVFHHILEYICSIKASIRRKGYFNSFSIVI